MAAYAPASDGTLPLRVDFAPRSHNTTTGKLLGASATGSANTWVTLTTK